MVIVVMAEVLGVLVVVVKVLVWDAAVINMVVVVEVFDVLVTAEIIVVGVIVIVLKFALPDLSSVDVPSDVTVDLFMDAVAGARLAVLPEIGIEVLSDVSANAFAVVMTALEFPVPTPLEEFSR